MQGAKKDYVGEKVAAWASAVSVLAKLAVKHPQAVYAGYTICLQNEWQYLCRTTPDIAHLMELLEQVLRNELLPAFLGVEEADVTNEFREQLAFRVKGGGLGIRNPMAVAEEFYNTSHDCCNYIRGALMCRFGHLCTTVGHQCPIQSVSY